MRKHLDVRQGDAHVQLARQVTRRGGIETRAQIFVRRDVQQPCVRVVGRWWPVLAAPQRRAERDFLADGGDLVGCVSRAAGFFVETREHVLAHERVRIDVADRTGGAVEQPQVAVASGVDESLDRPAVAGHVDQQRRAHFIPVPAVVPVILVMRRDLAAGDVERDHGRGIQVVAAAGCADPRPRVARAPVRDPRCGIIVAGEPRRHAAVFPCIAGPGFVPRFARPRDRIGLPHGFPGSGVECRDKPADAEFAAGNADHDLALRNQWRHRHVIPGQVILDLRFPAYFAGFRVQRDEERIDGGEVHGIAIQRDPTVRRVHLQQIFGQFATVAPDQIAAARVDREDLVLRGGHEHDAVVHERRRLVAFVDPGGVRPQRYE